MRVTIFGGTGGVGRHLVTQTAGRGHQVRAVVRQAVEMPAGVEQVVADDVLAAVADAVRDADVVLSALGLRRRRPSNPWSQITSPMDLTSRFATALVQAAPRSPPRMIVVSAAGVSDSRDRMSGVLRWMFDHSNIGVAYRDLERMEQTLATSTLDWIAVRPTTLTNAPETTSRLTDRYGATDKISRAAVAAWMLDHVGQPAPATRTPMITGP